MVTHSSILAWRIPWTEEAGGPQSMGSQRVRHDWNDSMHAALGALHFTEAQTTRQFLKGRKVQEIQRNLVSPSFNVSFPDGSVVKNLPANAGMQVWYLGQEDPLEKGWATHSSILAWEILWTEEPSDLQSKGSQRVGHNAVTTRWPVLRS